MNTLTKTTSDFREIMSVNADRFLVPMMIVGALTLAGWAVSVVSAAHSGGPF